MLPHHQWWWCGALQIYQLLPASGYHCLSFINHQFPEQDLTFWAVWAALSGCWFASVTTGGSFISSKKGQPQGKNSLDCNRDRSGNHGKIKTTHSRHREDTGGPGTWNYHTNVIDYWQVPSQIRACNVPPTLILLEWLHVAVVVKLHVLHFEQFVKYWEYLMNTPWSWRKVDEL